MLAHSLDLVVVGIRYVERLICLAEVDAKRVLKLCRVANSLSIAKIKQI